VFINKLQASSGAQRDRMLVERFDAANKAYAIDQKNRYMSRLSTRRAKESVLPLQGF
jgi:hypothetical protein